MKQDYVYLIDYAKLFSIGVTKATDLDTMGKFAQVLHETLHFEMDLHRQFAAEFGITNEELEATKPTPIIPCLYILYAKWRLKWKFS